MVLSHVAFLWDPATEHRHSREHGYPICSRWACYGHASLRRCCRRATDGAARAPDVDDLDDEMRLCCGHAGQEMDLGDLPFFLMLQDRPGRSATCPSPGRWSHPLQLNSWEPLQQEFSIHLIG